jgi:hypothetical protein
MGEGHDWAEAERRNRALSLVYVTRARPIEMVVGKASVILGQIVLTLIAALPVLAVLAWMGGMELATAGEAVLLALTGGLAGTAMGLVSGYAAGWRRILFFIMVVALFVGAMGDWGWKMPFHPGISIIEVALQTPLDRRVASPVQAAGFLTLLGCIFLLWAAALVPRAARTRPAPARAKRSAGRGSPLRGNPITWLAMRCGHVPGLGASLGLAAVLGALMLWAFAKLGQDAAPLVYLLAWTGTAVFPAFWTAATLARERRDKTMVTLAASPLPAKRILRGKLAAGLWRYLPVTLVVLAGFLFSLAGFPNTLKGLAYGLAMIVGGILLSLVLGLVFSLRARTPGRAALSAVGSVLGLQVLAYAVLPFPLGFFLMLRFEPGHLMNESPLLWNLLLALAVIVVFVSFRLVDRRLGTRRPFPMVLAYGLMVPLFLILPLTAMLQFHRGEDLPSYLFPFLTALPFLWSVLFLRYARLALDASMGRTS